MRLTNHDHEKFPFIKSALPLSISASTWIAIYKRLCEYEDAEEQGLLVQLPCKVGDIVYHIVSHMVDVTGYRMEWELETTVKPEAFRIWMVDAIGKTVFLTREEAEAALKGE